MKKKSLIIIETRDDAIGIFNNLLEKNLNKKKIDIKKFKFLKNKFVKTIQEFFVIPYLMFKLNKYNKILLTDSKPMKAFFSSLLKKEKYVFVHHVGKEPLYYKFTTGNYFNCVNRFDKIIAISENTKKELIENGINPKKIKIIYNGVDLKEFKPIKKQFNFKYVMYVGSEIKRKNLKNSLSAFKILLQKYPNLKFVKIGTPGSEKNRKETMKIIKELNIENNVVFTGRISTKELVEYYSNAELMFFPTLKEGFGYPLVEAMSCKCPIVTSDIAPHNEIVITKEYLANPNNPKEIAKKAEKLINNKQNTNKLVELNKKRSNLYNLENQIKQIEEILK
ncbi:MAG: glycosyltransferase family 4 protein [Candidatus Woesearchaeota archaeon]